MAKTSARQERDRRLLLILGVVLVISAITAAAVIFQSGRDTTGRQTQGPRSTAGSYSVALGEKTAPVRVVVYEDFQCPFCRQFEEQSRDFLRADAAKGKVYVEYRPFAFLDDYSGRSLNAFAAVLDANGPATALRFHNYLYDHQPTESGPWPSNAQLASMAARVGASSSKVRAGIESLAFKQWVINANDAASKAHVRQTPTVVVNGSPLTGASSIDQMVQTLETRIAKG
jgi:protein-disulfide isomerase